MEVILVMLWVSLGLVAFALIALRFSVQQGEADYSDKLAILPLDDQTKDAKDTKDTKSLKETNTLNDQ
jgi:hypothetical protein